MLGTLITTDVTGVVTSSVAVTNSFGTTYMTAFFSYAIATIVVMVAFAILFKKLF